MEKIIKQYRDNKDLMIPMIILVAVIGKIILHFILPEKYYYDNYRILATVVDPDYKLAWKGTYEVAADFFRKINILGFTQLYQWSIFLGVIFNSLLLALFSRSKGLDNKQSIFLLMCVGILNIYIFTIGKDAIQVLIFILLFIVIQVEIIPNWLKIPLCFGILYWESTFFRDYYILLAFLFLGVFVGISLVRKLKIKINIKKVVMIIICLYLMIYAVLSIAKVFMPDAYEEVMACKVNTTQLDSSSVIKDKIEHNGNLILYMENYVINSIRMAFPVELLSGGAFYVPFIFFQIFLIYYLIKCIKRMYLIDFKGVLALSIFISYFLGSVLFEPDFGSFVRHEAATFPVLYFIAFRPSAWKEYEQIKECIGE